MSQIYCQHNVRLHVHEIVDKMYGNKYTDLLSK